MLNTETDGPRRKSAQRNERTLEDFLRAFGPNIMALMRQQYWGVLCGQDLEDIVSINLFRLWTARVRFQSTCAFSELWSTRLVVLEVRVAEQSPSLSVAAIPPQNIRWPSVQDGTNGRRIRNHCSTSRNSSLRHQT